MRQPQARHPPRQFRLCHPSQSRPFRPFQSRPSPSQWADWCRQTMDHQSRHPEANHPPAPRRPSPLPHPSPRPWFRPPPTIHPPLLTLQPSFRRSPVIRPRHPPLWPPRFQPSPTLRQPRPSACHPSRHCLSIQCPQHPVQPRSLHRYRPLRRPRFHPVRLHHQAPPKVA